MMKIAMILIPASRNERALSVQTMSNIARAHFSANFIKKKLIKENKTHR